MCFSACFQRRIIECYMSVASNPFRKINAMSCDLYNVMWQYFKMFYVTIYLLLYYCVIQWNNVLNYVVKFIIKILIQWMFCVYRQDCLHVVVTSLPFFPMQSVPITTKVASSNPAHGEVYSMQHYVIKFVSDLRQISSFCLGLRFTLPIKLTAIWYNWK